MLGVLKREGDRVGYKRKLIEVALPLDVISAASAGEKSIRQGHPSALHQWWARRPLAAARAVLWASLVDDPSAHPGRFPTEEDRAAERKRLFEILGRLVKWENSNDREIVREARAEIESSCDGDLPNVLDPFCGGGAIPLEARRLGLNAYGGDLNPVAVLISKALVEIPPTFASLPPVNPGARAGSGLKTWEQAQGLAEDIGFYGRWMREQAVERIGHLYPKVGLPVEEGSGQAPVIAWIWARTISSPDPSWSGHVPLVRSWVLRKSKHNKPAAWVEPSVNRISQTISYRIREGEGAPDGTMGRGGGTCLATGTHISFDYIADQGRSGLIGRTPIATIAEGNRRRVYVPPAPLPCLPNPQWAPLIPLPKQTLGFRVQRYGMTEWADLFMDRQLVALTTFSSLLVELRAMVEGHALAAGLIDDGVRLREGGAGVAAYTDAVSIYLAFAIDKLADLNNSLVPWGSDVQCPRHLFSRQAIPMVWDFAEANPLGSSSGSWQVIVDGIVRAFRSKGWPLVQSSSLGEIVQGHAATRVIEVPNPMVCTDPPYYDNVPYADLSDFFYVWLRHNLTEVFPEETATLLTPKAEELVANPHRVGSKRSEGPGSPKDVAKKYFETGMAEVLSRIADAHDPRFPTTIFYAFKQQEAKGGIASTGWETFLQGLVDTGLRITATWPIRTETRGRLRAIRSAALASSIVIACRTRRPSAPLATRREFLDALEAELPKAVRLLQDQVIAPVDMAQSAIGPGMEVFSRYAKVLEADGTPMPVRTALALINEALEEALSAEETEFDSPTRWALTWYEQYGLDSGSFGDAETLAKAKNTSVEGVARAGIIDSGAGKVRLFNREELEDEWDPLVDRRLTVWKVAQQLIARLDNSETDAADLLKKVGGGVGDRARRLAYLLYQIADRKSRSADAVAYNRLIQSWHDIALLAGADQSPVAQTLEGM